MFHFANCRGELAVIEDELNSLAMNAACARQ